MSAAGESRIPTRLGDGALVEMTRSELRAEIEEGTQAAAKRAKVPPLTEDELAHLLDIFASPAAFVSVEQGDQLILSCDGTGSQIASSRLEDLREWEATLGSDLVELYHVDYSYKAIKTIRHVEQQAMRNVQLLLTVPVQYGAMPNLGLYSRPDGPVPNWSELMPQGRIEEARAAQEEAVEMAVEDMVFVGEGMWEAGADGIDFDTAGAAGDADFLATLRAVEELRRRCPDIGIELGMAAEFVLGMHGELSYDGVRLAGLWPKDQSQAGGQGRGDHVRPRRQRQHRQDRRLEHGARPDDRQALLPGVDHPRAHERGHGRRRGADDPVPARRRRLARGHGLP